ncbi:MAG: site-2 protease family protein [Candidatus Omnitrophica bacterium]|nr:site-2 protease family protein [Candidatus Omnitrophota bacterium]
MNILSILLYFGLSFGLLIIAITVHEFAHGFAAYKLGDSTAKYSGRLTLNPIAHIDLMGTIVVPLLLVFAGMPPIGWAKPIPINYWALRNPKRDIVIVGASGPISNIILAVILAVIIRIIPVPVLLGTVLIKLIEINVALGIFNLIPIPPLDGSRILMGLLPEPLDAQYASIEPYAAIILVALVWLGALNWILWPLVSIILKFLGV